MALEQILGFFTMWLHPEITATLWSKAGVPIWQTFLYATVWTSGTLVLTYFSVGWLKRAVKNIVKNSGNVGGAIQKVGSWYSGSGFKSTNDRYNKKIAGWLIRQKNWLILMCSFIPFVYGLPAAVIITAKLLEIKRALPILLLGNVFRNAIICGLIYGSFNFFS